MVNFFIGRPIFATVLALLMLLVGSICMRVLPISLLCVTRTDCKGLLIGFSAGSDADLRHAASMLAASLV